MIKHASHRLRKHALACLLRRPSSVTHKTVLRGAGGKNNCRHFYSWRPMTLTAMTLLR